MVLCLCELSLSQYKSDLWYYWDIGLSYHATTSFLISFLLESENRIYYCFIFYIYVFEFFHVRSHAKGKQGNTCLCFVYSYPSCCSHFMKPPHISLSKRLFIYLFIFSVCKFAIKYSSSSIYLKESGLFLWPVTLLFSLWQCSLSEQIMAHLTMNQLMRCVTSTYYHNYGGMIIDNSSDLND